MTLQIICVMGLGSMVLLNVFVFVNDFTDHLRHGPGLYGFIIGFCILNDFIDHLRHGLGLYGFTMCF